MNHTMLPHRTFLLTLCLTGALLTGSARADSIWARSRPSQRMVFADDVARDVGDLLTIVVNEQSRLSSDTARDMTKTDSRRARIEQSVPLIRAIDRATGGIFSLDGMDLSASATTSFSGDADFNSRNILTDQITVVVEDVLPNGNLVVLGKRQRDMHGERQVVQVSGIVRPSDVTYANTIRSDRVANFHVVYQHVGAENRFTRPGWLAQVLNFLNPF